jgi:PAS domain-containing protein
MSITKLAYKKGTYQSLIFRESIGKKIKKSLDFLAEVCVLKNAFISFKEDESELIYNKLGLPNWKKIGDKIYFKENSNGTKDLHLLNYENELNSYKFFKGFPITINNEYFGSLCLLGEDIRTLTETELTIIEHTIFNIESIIKLDLKINDITCIEKENRRKFRVYEENSNEILYQINLDGIFSYASKNLIESVGFEPSEVIGKNFHKFIHPDDMDACIYYLSKIKLNIQKTA